MRKYLGVLPLVVVLACNGNSDKASGQKDTVAISADQRAAINAAFKEPKVEAIYTSYLQLKNALVAGKVEEGQKAAKALVPALKNLSGCENTSLIADHIAGAKDIKVQRKEFTALSNDVIALLKHSDLAKGTLYVQHCPMANNGDGGDWVAAEKKIQNPYFGEEMMECGAVIAEIKAK